MSKLIAVCGSPESGKTTLALKLAQELYYSMKTSVLFLSVDLNVPIMGYVFPHCKESDLYSIGKTLDKTDIYREDVMKQIVTVKTMMNFGYLGFKAGENKYSYPRPTEDKVLELFRCMSEIAEYVVIDCVSDNEDFISILAKREADVVIQAITPDLKCMTYFASNGDAYLGCADKTTIVMNTTEKDLYLPFDEVKNHFKKVQFVLPYSLALKQQTITGTLSERLADRKYREVISKLAKAVS
ncbi:MAG: ATP-binding protein [Clostridia bacterium]|nr:ATP-binding protein [Clostridia bacterium]